MTKEEHYTIIFNIKKEWFEKIKSGKKTHEYREVKPYWTKRFLNKGLDILPFNQCEFVCGYARKDDKTKRLKANILSIDTVNGKNTDLGIDKDVYDIEFELLEE